MAQHESGINYPKVQASDIEGFALAWESGGIKMILDATTKKFAIDFANVVLRSYVDDLVMKAYKVKQAKIAATGLPPVNVVSTTPVLPSAPQKSSLVLTDA